jgi:hypothetical protein
VRAFKRGVCVCYLESSAVESLLPRDWPNALKTAISRIRVNIRVNETLCFRQTMSMANQGKISKWTVVRSDIDLYKWATFGNFGIVLEGNDKELCSFEQWQGKIVPLHHRELL